MATPLLWGGGRVTTLTFVMLPGSIKEGHLQATTLFSNSQLGKQSNMHFKVWLNRYRWSAGKPGSGYIWWFRRIECIDRRFLTMSRLSKSLCHTRSCRNSSEYSKTAGNFLPLLMIPLLRKLVWEIFNIISSDARFPIFYLRLWCCSSRGILI